LINVDRMFLIKMRIERIIRELAGCPPLSNIELKIESMELKENRYYEIRGRYRCTSIFNVVIDEGSFNIAIDGQGNLYSAKVSSSKSTGSTVSSIP